MLEVICAKRWANSLLRWGVVGLERWSVPGCLCFQSKGATRISEGQYLPSAVLGTCHIIVPGTFQCFKECVNTPRVH
jgi:hypothetical protein